MILPRCWTSRSTCYFSCFIRQLSHVGYSGLLQLRFKAGIYPRLEAASTLKRLLKAGASVALHLGCSESKLPGTTTP